MSTVSRSQGGPGCRPKLSLWALTVRACRVVLLPAVIFFALAGALTTPPYVVLVFAPAFGICIAGMVATVNPAFPKTASARRTAVYFGTGTTLLIPCLAGIGQFGTAGTVIALVLIVLACVVVGSWIAESCHPSNREAAADADVDVEQLRQFVRVLSMSMLLREWRLTGEDLQTWVDPDCRAMAIQVRNLLLEELSRRDPAGVAQWLSEGDEEAPEQYLRGDEGAAT